MSEQKQSRPQGGAPMGPGGGNMMMMSGKKAKDFKGTLRRLIGYLKPRRNSLIAVFFAAILSTVFMIVGPKIMGNAITELFEGAYGKATGVPEQGLILRQSVSYSFYSQGCMSSVAI